MFFVEGNRNFGWLVSPPVLFLCAFLRAVFPPVLVLWVVFACGIVLVCLLVGLG